MLAIHKLQKARIRLQKDNSFFAMLSLYLKFKEDTKKCKENNGIAYISPQGVFGFDEEKVLELTDDECKFLVAHEVFHLAFLHLIRQNNRHPQLWNIAVDLAANTILQKNNFVLIDGVIKRDNKNEFKFGDIVISNVDTLSGEQIFDKLEKAIQNNSQDGIGEDYKGLDTHIFTDEKGNELTTTEKEELRKEWLGKLNEAYMSSKMRGNAPAGIDILIENLTKHKIDWKVLLRKYVVRHLPNNQTYSRPNKKSISNGFYMPDYIKDEKIDIVVGIDTSGSIGQKELTEFLSEVVGISQEFRNNINMTIVTHDYIVHTNELITNANKDKILKTKLKGGGGTSHKDIFELIKKTKTKIAIFFTDGDSDIDEIDMKKYNFDKLFIINEGGMKIDEELKGDAKALYL